MKDWNDALRAGIDIRAVADKQIAEQQEKKVNGNAKPEAFKLTCLADLDAKPIDWLR
jgi:hypothetical protein